MLYATIAVQAMAGAPPLHNCANAQASSQSWWEVEPMQSVPNRRVAYAHRARRFKRDRHEASGRAPHPACWTASGLARVKGLAKQEVSIVH